MLITGGRFGRSFLLKLEYCFLREKTLEGGRVRALKPTQEIALSQNQEIRRKRREIAALLKLYSIIVEI